MPLNKSMLESSLMSIERTSSSPLPSLVNPVTGTNIGVPYNQQNIGVTTRPPATALLTIDSEDRFKNYEDKRTSKNGGYNNSPYDFTITKNESLMNGFFTRLAVSEINFPTDDLPNISDTTDQIYVQYKTPFFSSVSTSLVSLQQGFYTPHELATEFQTRVIETIPLLSSFEISYGSNGFTGITPQFQYVTYNPSTLVAFQPLPYNSKVYPYNNNTRQLYDLMGFSPNTDNSIPSQLGITDKTNCQGTKYIDIVSPQLSYNQSLKDTSSQSIVRDSLCRLYLTPNSYNNVFSPADPNYTPPGTVPTTIYRNFTQPKQIAWTPNQPIGQLTFQVYDDCGNLVKPVQLNFLSTGQVSYVPNNVNWSMTLQVTEN